MQGKVKVGPATIAGYGATVIGLVASVLVAVFGVDQEQAALVASAVWTIVAFSWTQWGRYAQARDAAKRAPQPIMLPPVPIPDFSNVRVEGGSMAPSPGTFLKGTTGSTPSPHAYVKTNHPGNDVMRDNALDPNPPEVPDKSLANPTLDDPEFAGVPTAAEHSHLKG